MSESLELIAELLALILEALELTDELILVMLASAEVRRVSTPSRAVSSLSSASFNEVALAM